MPVYNTVVPVVALVRAKNEKEAERLLADYIDSTSIAVSALAIPVKALREGTFESEPVPEEHVLDLSEDEDYATAPAGGRAGEV